MEVKINLSGHRNKPLEEMGFVFIGSLHVDLSDQELDRKVAEFLAPHISSGDVVTLAMPGLAPLAIIVLTVVHGLTGQFPRIQSLVRSENGKFLPGPVLDLQDVRNGVARKRHREGVVRL